MAQILFFGKLSCLAGSLEPPLALPANIQMINNLFSYILGDDFHLCLTLQKKPPSRIVNETIEPRSKAISNADEIAIILLVVSVQAERPTLHEQTAVFDMLIIHRVEHIEAGEEIVLVYAASIHSHGALKTAAVVMVYLKTEVFFWKKEQKRSGRAWIDPRASNHLNSERSKVR